MQQNGPIFPDQVQRSTGGINALDLIEEKIQTSANPMEDEEELVELFGTFPTDQETITRRLLQTNPLTLYDALAVLLLKSWQVHFPSA